MDERKRINIQNISNEKKEYHSHKNCLKGGIALPQDHHHIYNIPGGIASLQSPLTGSSWQTTDAQATKGRWKIYLWLSNSN